MEQIQMLDAVSRLSQIAEHVRRTGQAVTLTQHGEPYVDLVPHQGTPSAGRPQSVVLAELELLSKRLPKSKFADIQADISEGRR